MKLFKCANGTLINQNLVTNCFSGQGENKYFAKFNFGTHAVEVLFDRATYAEDEIKAFCTHCEEQTTAFTKELAELYWNTLLPASPGI